MLKTTNLSVYSSRSKEFSILTGIELSVQAGEFVAVVGPSGCGKSTLLKAIAGLAPYTEGQMSWLNREITGDYDIAPEKLGYVPQFGIFHQELTVGEILMDATVLRLAHLTVDSLRERVDKIADLSGLEKLIDRRASVLSGGQRRRLALGIELVSEPSIILADEVTSGLDPKSSSEITLLLRSLATRQGMIVLHVTHELSRLYSYDSILVLIEGAVAFRGTPAELTTYFQTDNPEKIFEKLGETSSEEWRFSEERPFSGSSAPSQSHEGGERMGATSLQGSAGWMAQTLCLTRRRLRIFTRNKTQVCIQILLLFVFPGIVVLFALKGLPQVQNMDLGLETNSVFALRDTLNYSSQVDLVGRLVSGLSMFQVILLALMGANNGAREVAAERNIFEKEKLSGLSTSAYLTSKVAFLTLLVLTQSISMTILVKTICNLPGNFLEQLAVLGLGNLSVTLLSLAISSWSKTAEQASLIALYVVGFQLPLSGAVLALPNWLATATRPFIAAYWSWSGYLQTLRETRLYDLIMFSGTTSLDRWTICIGVLSFQSLIFLMIAFLGCYRSSLSD